MVIGEPQILGQVRKAYALSVKTGAAGRILNRLLPAAFHAAKRVRTDTNIANSAVSVSYMAVELGRKIFESLPGRTVLVIGAGETAELCARHLRKAGIERVMFTNRTHSRAEALAQTFLGEAVAFDHLEDHLATADIVICSTAAPDYLITSAQMNQVMRVRNTPIVLIDISVPRNIDSALGNTGNVFLFNIDDLQALVLSNLEERQREAVRAESMVEEEVGRFGSSLRSMEMGAAIGKFRANMLAIALSELQRSRRLLGELTSDQERAIEGLLRDTVNKISHPLIGELKQLSLLDVQK
jgi:glutamyl-tRNA reductase